MLLSHTTRPPASARAARPFSVHELDAHPDRDRLWATILQMREEAEEAVYAHRYTVNDQSERGLP